MTAPLAKIVVIGIDAANPDLFRRWAQEGILPNCGDLLERGLVGRTKSVEGFFVGATWPSFYTGVTPARHGCHFLTQLRPGSYHRYNVADHGVSRFEPFWRRLSRAGRRVAVLDVPLAPLESSLNGVQVVEWGSHDAVYGFSASPSSLGAAIDREFGSHPSGRCCDGERRTPAEWERFISALVEGARLKGALTRHVLREGNWDFFIQVFTEAHCAGHQCWHLHDTQHPMHDPVVVARVGDPLQRVYVSIDNAIGEIIRHADGALVVLLIAHGMHRWFGANFLLPEMLCRLGVTAMNAASSDSARASRTGLQRAWRRLPIGFRRAVGRLRSKWRPAITGLPFDPSRSLCFPHHNGQAVSGIRLNQIGREPGGTLDAGAADAFCADLTSKLLEIVDDRGTELVRRVLRTRDLYAGEFAGHLPDLLVEWNEEAATSLPALPLKASSPQIGVAYGVNEYTRTGEHRPAGMFIATGRDVRRAQLDRVVSILDFAPTFTSLLGVDFPDPDGQRISELIG